MGRTTGGQSPAGLSHRRTIEDVRRALMRLPYYGVFDFLAFQYEKGTVTLSGYTVRPVLRSEAVRALKRVARVDQVIDTVEELPVSPHDEQLRWATFNAIYDDAFLARYVPGGSLVRFDRYLSRARHAARSMAARPSPKSTHWSSDIATIRRYRGAVSGAAVLAYVFRSSCGLEAADYKTDCSPAIQRSPLTLGMNV
jgi:hypothetical protein